MEYMTEETLLSEFKKGNERAFAQIVERFKSMLVLEVYYIVRDADTAQDIVQELFLKLWSKRKELDIRGSLTPYLLLAARNNAISYLRKMEVVKKNEDGYGYLQDMVVEYRPFENQELAVDIEQAIDSISAPACKRVFKLLYLEKKTHREISSELNISIQVVKNQVYRALKIVREKLSHYK